MSKKPIMEHEDLELLIDYSPDAMALSDKDGRILAINENLAKVFEKPKETLIGTSGYEHIETKASTSRRKIIKSVITSKEKAVFIDKERGRWWKATFQPILGKNGHVTKLGYYIQDITEQKEEEQKKLQNQEQYFEVLIKNSTDLITVADDTGKVLFESPALKKLLGFEPYRGINKSIFDLIHPSDIKKIKKTFKEVIAQPDIVKTITYRIKDADERYHYFESIANNQVFNPLINGLIINSRDITEQQKDKKDLYNQKQFLENLVNSTKEIIFTVDKEHHVGIWNNATERKTGISKNTISSKKLHDLTLFENRTELHSYLDNVFSGKEAVLKELIANSESSGRRVWSVSPSLLHSDKGISDVIFVCQDITLKGRLHQRLIPGNSYLISDLSTDLLFELSTEYLNNGWNGILVTRNSTESFVGDMPDFKEGTVTVISYDDAVKASPDLERLYNTISEFLEKKAPVIIFLERVDYLIIHFGFQQIMNLMYRVNDLIRLKQSLFLLKVNKSLFSNEQIVYLQEEFNTLPLQQIEEREPLEETISDILRYISKKNEKNSLVSQKNICSYFGFSKEKAKHQIEVLVKNGYLSTRTISRSTYLYVTQKGREMLQQQKEESTNNI